MTLLGRSIRFEAGIFHQALFCSTLVRNQQLPVDSELLGQDTSEFSNVSLHGDNQASSQRQSCDGCNHSGWL